MISWTRTRWSAASRSRGSCTFIRSGCTFSTREASKVQSRLPPIPAATTARGRAQRVSRHSMARTRSSAASTAAWSAAVM
jgi:hypothetical protein